MSWRSAILAAAGLGFVSLGLAGCGFHPLYGEHEQSGLDGTLAAIQVDQIRDRLGQILTNQLRDGFNPTSAGIPARYRLSVSLVKQEYDSALRSDGTASHTTIRITASYALHSLGDNKLATSGTVNSTNGLDVLDNQYANTIGEQTEETRAVHDIGEQIRERVVLYLQQVASKS
jgi:LPS-assembly lipoprotein